MCVHVCLCVFVCVRDSVYVCDCGAPKPIIRLPLLVLAAVAVAYAYFILCVCSCVRMCVCARVRVCVCARVRVCPQFLRACERVGVALDDLDLKPRAAFALVEGKAIAAGPAFAEEQWQSYVRRKSRTLAAVLAERDRMTAAEEAERVKQEAFTRQMLLRFDEEMQAEAAKVAREERALAKLAKVRPGLASAVAAAMCGWRG